MDIMQAKQPHRRQHQDAVAGAKIAAVHGGKKLQYDHTDPPRLRRFTFSGGQTQQAIHGSLDHEQNRRKQNQQRNQACKHRRWGDDQKPRAHSTSNQADYAQAHQNQRTVIHLATITKQTANLARPQGHRTGSIRDLRIETEPDQ